MPVTHWCFASIRWEGKSTSQPGCGVVCFGLAAGQGQAGEVTRRGRSLADCCSMQCTLKLAGSRAPTSSEDRLATGTRGGRDWSSSPYAAFVAAACARSSSTCPTACRPGCRSLKGTMRVAANGWSGAGLEGGQQPGRGPEASQRRRGRHCDLQGGGSGPGRACRNCQTDGPKAPRLFVTRVHK